MPAKSVFLRLASIAWFATGLARWFFALVDPPQGITPSVFVSGSIGGGLLAIAIGAFLWLRPGLASALVGALLGLSAVLSLTFGSWFGWASWFVIPEALVLFGFGLCAVGLWQVIRQDRAGKTD